ncbi:HEAT repeat domain-containing protein [Roseivirga sp. BDSF3-8]|uniref:HEAT repeat domain-containing protein n=1 Tax=Roseivirga sp. BDSF3-8 TaxID=3241598 RepID=UPI0035324AAD
MVRYLKKASPVQAERAIEKLSLAGDRALPVMKLLLEEGNWHLRLQAVKCLSGMKGEESMELLKTALRDPIEKVSEQACEALAKRNLNEPDRQYVEQTHRQLAHGKSAHEEKARKLADSIKQKKESVNTRFKRGLEKHSDLAVHHIGYYQRRKAIRFGMIETGTLAIIAGALLLLLSFAGSFSKLPYAELFFQAMSTVCLGSGSYQLVKARLIR